MAAAIAKNDIRAQIFGVIAMGVVIIVVDRLIWWPLVVWSRKFKLDDFGTGGARKSPLQLWLARSAAAHFLGTIFAGVQQKLVPPPIPPTAETSLAAPGALPPRRSPVGRIVYYALVVVLVVLLARGAVSLVQLLVTQVRLADWLAIRRQHRHQLPPRVLAAVLIGTLWTVPFGIWIGLNPKLSKRLQPFIQFVASYPAPMLYPWRCSASVLSRARHPAMGRGAAHPLWHPVVYSLQCRGGRRGHSERHRLLRGDPASLGLAPLVEIPPARRAARPGHRLDHRRGGGLERHHRRRSGHDGGQDLFCDGPRRLYHPRHRR